jgi:hypothetical protein
LPPDQVQTWTRALKGQALRIGESPVASAALQYLQWAHGRVAVDQAAVALATAERYRLLAQGATEWADIP